MCDFSTGICSTSISFWLMEGALDMLQASSKDWNAVSYEVFVTAGAIWGAIGPARMFGPSSVYFPLLLGFPIGLLLPAIPWLANKFYPSKFWHLINVPILLGGMGVGSDRATVVMGFIVATIFQWYLYNHKYAWWSKYNYTLSAALDTGSSFATLLIGILVTLNISPGNSVLNPVLPQDYCFAPLSSS